MQVGGLEGKNSKLPAFWADDSPSSFSKKKRTKGNEKENFSLYRSSSRGKSRLVENDKIN